MLINYVHFWLIQIRDFQIKDKHLLFYYDLGSGNLYLSLDYVEVNDGEWHIVRIRRYGNQAVLRLDSGEGRFYNETYIHDDGHMLMFLDERVHGAAYVTYQLYTNRAVTSNDLIECKSFCINWGSYSKN